MFTLLYNDHPLYKMCIERSRVVAPDLQVITERAVTTGSRTYAQDTDIERIFHLLNNPYETYLDADAILLKPFDFPLEPGFVYCGFNDLQSESGLDFWCIIGNGCRDVFDYLASYFYIEECNVKPMWAHRLLSTDLRDRVKPIPAGYVRHLALHTTAVWCEQNPGKSNSGLGYSAVYKNGQWELEIGQ